MNNSYATAEVEVLHDPQLNNPLPDGYTTYRVFVALHHEAESCYVIFGDENNQMAVPAAYGAAGSVGESTEVAWSWLNFTLAAESDSLDKISSTGVEFGN